MEHMRLLLHAHPPAGRAPPLQHFYKGRVRTGVTAEDRPPVKVRVLKQPRRQLPRCAGLAGLGVHAAGSRVPGTHTDPRSTCRLPHLAPPTPLPPQGVPWSSQDCPVLFINVPEGREERTASSGGGRGGGRGSDSEEGEGGAGGGNGGASYCNHVEAEMAVRALLRLMEGDPELRSVALLSPYRRGRGGAALVGSSMAAWQHGCVACAPARLAWPAFTPPPLETPLPAQTPRLPPPPCSGQVRLLNSLVAKEGLPEEALQRCSLTVSTVDGYQGREADAVIFSAVRRCAAPSCGPGLPHMHRGQHYVRGTHSPGTALPPRRRPADLQQQGRAGGLPG